MARSPVCAPARTGSRLDGGPRPIGGVLGVWGGRSPPRGGVFRGSMNHRYRRVGPEVGFTGGGVRRDGLWQGRVAGRRVATEAGSTIAGRGRRPDGTLHIGRLPEPSAPQSPRATHHSTFRTGQQWPDQMGFRPRARRVRILGVRPRPNGSLYIADSAGFVGGTDGMLTNRGGQYQRGLGGDGGRRRGQPEPPRCQRRAR